MTAEFLFSGLVFDICVSLGEYFILVCLIVLALSREIITVLVLQAEKSDWNSIGIFKVSNISGKRRDLLPKKSNADGSDMEDESSESDTDSEDEGDGGSGMPILQVKFHCSSSQLSEECWF